MNESQLYERLGRLQSALEDKALCYDRVLELLAKVVAGEIDASRVIVNLTDRSWAYSEAGTRPSAPSTINGLPIVAIAPDDTQVGPFRDDAGEVFVSGRGLSVIRVLATAEPDA